VFRDGIRWSIRDRVDDDRLLETLADILELPSPVEPSPVRRSRHVRATAETRFRVRLALGGTGRGRGRRGCGWSAGRCLGCIPYP